MSTTDTAAPSADEQPKKATAKKVVAPKRRYFVPKHSSTISGSFVSPQEAVDALEKKLKTKKAKKVGDG